jgi:hypothetical protein
LHQGTRLGSFSYHTGPSEPQLTSSGRATRAEWLSSTRQTKDIHIVMPVCFP